MFLPWEIFKTFPNMHVKALFENSLNISHLHQISWLTALFGVILPFKDKTQIKKS